MPTVRIYPTDDTWAWTGEPSLNQSGTSTLRFGIYESSAHEAWFHFDLSSIPAGAKVTAATFRIFQTLAVGTTTISLHEVTGSWVHDTLTWDNRPSKSSTELDVENTTGGTSYMYWNAQAVADVVQAWHSGARPNYGFNLARSSTTTASAAPGCRAINSGESTDEKTYLDVTYNEPPSAPGAFTDPTSGEVVDTTSTVTFGAASDPEGDSLTYDTDLSTDNGASWTNIRSAQPETSFTYDFTSQPATTAAKLRARARDTGGLTSAYTVGPAFTIQHNTAPNPATWVSPASGSTLHRAITQRLDWDFSDPDTGDSQSKYDLRYRITGTSTWTTVSSTTTVTYHDFAANALAAGDYEAQVLTYDSTGVAATGWSTSLLFTMADAPGAPTITSPTSGGTIAANVGTVAWSVASQTAAQVRKVADNAGAADTATVYYDSGTITSSTARDHALTYPVNGRYEHLQVRIQADGLWSSWASIRVRVSYTPPSVPTISVSAGDTAITSTVAAAPWAVAVSAVAYTGTGTGTMAGPTATEGTTDTHNWTATCVTAAVDGGTFDVAKDGTVVGQATVGTEFVNEGLAFTINDGATDFAVGDKFSWSTTAVKVSSFDLHRRQGSNGEGIRIKKQQPAGGLVDYTPASGVAYEYKVVANGDNTTSTSSAWTS